MGIDLTPILQIAEEQYPGTHWALVDGGQHVEVSCGNLGVEFDADIIRKDGSMIDTIYKAIAEKVLPAYDKDNPRPDHD